MTELGRILVIDDSVTLLTKMKERLVKEGFDVVTTANTVGNAGLLKGTDMVIIDFHMPGHGGPAVLNALKKAAEAINAKPMFYLHTTDQNEAASYKKYGFDGAFAMKGNFDALAKQVCAAFRMLKIRKLSKA